jgi:hypothetical protein
MAKRIGAWNVIHNAIEATAMSEVVDCTGYNALALYITFSATQNWTFAIYGNMATSGAFLPVLINGTALSKQTNASGMIIFKDVPNYVQVLATEDVNGAAVTVYAAPVQV